MNILKKPITLECECCFQLTRALEKFDPTDDGMGICKKCFAEVVRRHGYDYAVALHGKPRLHHSLSLKDDMRYLFPIDIGRALARLTRAKIKYENHLAILSHAQREFNANLKVTE